MFENILGKIKTASSSDNKEQKDLVEKISKMNLSDMKTYVNDRISDFPISEDGLNEVLRKLLNVNENTSKRYIEIDDMDSKIKKGFDLILSILKNKKVTIVTIELVNKLLENSKDIIEKYDKDNQDIYSSRFKTAINTAIENVNKKLDLKIKMDLMKR